jgi:hypothetical protein
MCMYVYSTAIASIGGVLRWRRRPPSWRTTMGMRLGRIMYTHTRAHIHTRVRLNAARPVFVGIVGTASACNCWYIYIYSVKYYSSGEFFFFFRSAAAVQWELRVLSVFASTRPPKEYYYYSVTGGVPLHVVTQYFTIIGEKKTFQLRYRKTIK